MRKVNRENLFNFVANYENIVIGEDKKGNKTTVADEFVAMYKLATRYVSSLNSLHNKKAGLTFSDVELSVEELEAAQSRCFRLLRNACRKALWLNSQCEQKIGERFVRVRLDMNNAEECSDFIHELFEAVNDTLSIIETGNVFTANTIVM